jgi:Putative zinc-finger
MTRWSCRAARRALEAYHDGELSMDGQVAVQAHLRDCAACSGDWARLQAVSAGLRVAAAVRTVEDAETLGRRVLARLVLEPRRPLVASVRALFVDMRLVWPAIGATLAILICAAASLGLMRQTLREQPASMAALIGALADPGSNRNPVAPDGRMLLPRAYEDGIFDTPVVDREEAVFALAAVVTREGRVSNLELLLQDAGRAPIGPGALLELLDAASQTRFEPARSGGAPVAVNMVWLLAQTRVRGKASRPAPAARPRGVTQSRPVPPADHAVRAFAPTVA